MSIATADDRCWQLATGLGVWSTMMASGPGDEGLGGGIRVESLVTEVASPEIINTSRGV